MASQPDSDPVGADTTGDDTLPPTEATDSDELRNADGDVDVTAPDQWQAADESALTGDADSESLDDKLAAEEPDVSAEGPPRTPADDVPARRHHGQIDGAPEDGDSFFTVEK